MDTFSACVALGPLAIYLLMLGMINLVPRPLVISGTRETLSLALALVGLVTIGPMQLFMPQEAAARFGELVWLLLFGFYGLSLALVIMLSRPRLIIYNIAIEQLRPILEETTRRLDSDTAWAGPAVSMPLAHVHLRVEHFAPLGSVSLVASGDDQSIGGWHRLQTALRDSLRETSVPAQPHGFWLALSGFAVLIALAFWAVDDPQTLAQGLSRLLRP
jgi:hypothetical protein